jgi:putative phage-type endonuclease
MYQDLVQGSDEWKQARIGSLGASVVHEVMAKTKSGFAASRANRMAALLLERLTGKSQDIFQTQAMLQGIEREPEARFAYTFQTDNEVTEVGIFKHPSLIGTHASPDGLVGEHGLVEIKCVQPAAHLETILDQNIPDRYIVQMLWQMRCCGRDWCDYVSYNPDFPPSMRLFVKRVTYHTSRGLEIEDTVRQFLIELKEKEARLAGIYGREAP